MIGTTWAPKRQTPSIEYCCKWEKLSCIGAITLAGQLLEQSYEHAIKGVQVRDFLQSLAESVEGRLLIFWDNAPIHRSALVKTYLESDEGNRFTIVPLPPYAPECNPIEWLWAWIKKNHLANLAAKNLDELKAAWRRALEAARGNKDLISACFKASTIAHVLELA